MFLTIINLIIFLLFGLICSILIIFGETIFSNDIEVRIGIILFIFLVGYLIIIFIIKKLFHEPVRDLELAIKNFLVGNLKNKEIKFIKTLNPHLNYVLLFFSKTLNTLKSIKSEFVRGKEIKGEVELAREIQWTTFNKKLIEVPELNIVANSKPAAEIGGDSYDIIKQGDNYYIYVGDATGHGVGAGFIMMMVNALVSGFAKVYKSGSDILSNTNKILKPRVKANLLMTLLLIRWDFYEKKLYMTGAGHEYLIIYKHNIGKCLKVKSGGVALGMVNDISKALKESEVNFEENDVIVLYSDGITEAINKGSKDGTEQMFGEDRLISAIEKAPNALGEDYKTARTI
ncbi:hypothetical protein CSA08_01285, partial [Candidatus Gracilibacteria bacterium]